MLQVSRNKITEPDKSELERLKAGFAETSCLFLPQFLDVSILNYFLRRLATTRFVPKFELDGQESFGKVLFVPPDEAVIFTFHFLLNNPKLFRLIRAITACQAIGNFFGRMHRSEPQQNHLIDWHGDNADNRLIGMTIDLSSEEYTGGKFQLRENNSEKILREINRTKPGDAFIFRIAPGLQHRLTTLESGGNRTVGVGWFRSQPDWQVFSRDYFQSFEIQKALCVISPEKMGRKIRWKPGIDSLAVNF